MLRDDYKRKEEHNAEILVQREREFDEYKKNVEIEWPARFENRVNEIAEKARKQMAEKEAEFAVARQRWLEEATENAHEAHGSRMNEVQASFAQKEEELQRKYLQKQHEMTVQMEKTTSELAAAATIARETESRTRACDRETEVKKHEVGRRAPAISPRDWSW